jgi:hypothetical protein
MAVDAQTFNKAMPASFMTASPKNYLPCPPIPWFTQATITMATLCPLLDSRLGNQIGRDEFIAIMQALKLAYPRYIDQALPANQSCGLPQQS